MSMTEGSKTEGLHEDIMAEATTFCLPDDNAADLRALLADLAENHNMSDIQAGDLNITVDYEACIITYLRFNNTTSLW